MSNESLQNYLCEQLIRASTRVHYYKRVGRRMANLHWSTRLVPLTVALAGGGLLLGLNLLVDSAETNTFHWLELTVAGIIIVPFVLDYVLNFGKQEMVAHILARDCGQIRDDYKGLRDRLSDPDANEVEIRRAAGQR